MASHSRSGFQLWALGSVTDRVLQTSKLPLLIVRPQDSATSQPTVHGAAERQTDNEISAWPGYKRLRLARARSSRCANDYAQHLVTLRGREITLTPTEYRILAYLAQNAGRVVTQDLLLERVWGGENTWARATCCRSTSTGCGARSKTTTPSRATS
jgi:hypothetical protein